MIKDFRITHISDEGIEVEDQDGQSFTVGSDAVFEPSLGDKVALDIDTREEN